MGWGSGVMRGEYGGGGGGGGGGIVRVEDFDVTHRTYIRFTSGIQNPPCEGPLKYYNRMKRPCKYYTRYQAMTMLFHRY